MTEHLVKSLSALSIKADEKQGFITARCSSRSTSPDDDFSTNSDDTNVASDGAGASDRKGNQQPKPDACSVLDRSGLTSHPVSDCPKSGDNVILRSRTGACFHASLQSLAHHSSFFQSLLDLSKPVRDNASDDVSLPCRQPRPPVFKSSFAQSVENLRARTPQLTATRSIDSYAFFLSVQQAFQLVDTYDISNFCQLLACR